MTRKKVLFEEVKIRLDKATKEKLDKYRKSKKIGTMDETIQFLLKNKRF